MLKATGAALPAQTMTPISALKLIDEAPPKLRDKYRVRKAANTLSMDELVASIRHVGVIFPLVIVEGKYVTAGNRRLTALRTIYSDGNFEAATVNSEDFGGDAREIALATNVALPMHPVDKFEILASLVADGMKPDDVAAHYGLSPRQYAQTMKLAGLSPVIRDAWRDGKIGAKAAQAFTLTDDLAAQGRLLKRLQKDFGPDRDIGEHAVRNTLRDTKQSEVGRFLAYVGADAYRAAGGVINEDLFGDDHTVSDTKLLQKMVDETTAEIINGLMTEGWGFAMLVGPNMPPDRYSYGELSKPYNAERKAKSGVFFKLNERGEIVYEYGKTKPVDRSKKSTAKTAGAGKASGSKGAKSEPVQPAKVSQALATRLSLMLRAATQESIKIVGKSGGGLVEALAKVVADQMDYNYTVQQAAVEFRKHLPAKTFNEAMAKNFDATDYFNGTPKKMLLDAIKDVGLFEQAKKITKSSELRKFATKHVTPTGWLPRELRTPHYAQPKKAKT